MRLSVDVEQLAILKGPGTSRLLQVSMDFAALTPNGGSAESARLDAALEFRVREPLTGKPQKVLLTYMGDPCVLGHMHFEFSARLFRDMVRVTYWYNSVGEGSIARFGQEPGTVGFIRDLAA